jgi:hypothetical protein
MIEPAIFQRLVFPEFDVVYATDNMIEGTRFYEGPAPAWCAQVLPEDMPNIVECPSIFMLTAGRIRIENVDLDTVEYTRGQGVSQVRSKNRYRFTVLENGTGYLCLIPRSDIIYQREAVNVAPGTTFTVPAEAEKQFVFIATDGIEGQPRFSLIGIEPGEEMGFTASADSFLVRVWR